MYLHVPLAWTGLAGINEIFMFKCHTTSLSIQHSFFHTFSYAFIPCKVVYKILGDGWIDNFFRFDFIDRRFAETASLVANAQHVSETITLWKVIIKFIKFKKKYFLSKKKRRNITSMLIMNRRNCLNPIMCKLKISSKCLDWSTKTRQESGTWYQLNKH